MRNGARYIGESLASVFAQTCQDFEIILIDDGSTDGGAEMAARQFPDPRLTIVRQPPLTLRRARPAALERCRGEFIAFIDHDDLWRPHKLAEQVETFRRHSNTALCFSDCDIIDADGVVTGRLSDQFQFDTFDLGAGRAHLELLRRGNFVGYSSAMVRRAAVQRVGGFNRAYQYVSDYDLWLRLARLFDLDVCLEPLASYRVHDVQFTQMRSEITLAEHRALLLPIIRSDSYPSATRRLLGDHLLGQHRLAASRLWRQHRAGAALQAAAGIAIVPGPALLFARDRLRDSVSGRVLEMGVWAATVVHAISVSSRLGLIRGPRRLRRKFSPRLRREHEWEHIWMDGSALDQSQAGYFNLVSEWLRVLATKPTTTGRVVHVTTTAAGRKALHERLGNDAATLRFHRIGWRELHWLDIYQVLSGWHAQLLIMATAALLSLIGVVSGAVEFIAPALILFAAQIAALADQLIADFRARACRPRLTVAARLLRALWRRLPAPHGLAPNARTTEFIVWRGRFRWRDSKRIGVVQDLTTRLRPDLHTPENVSEQDEFLRYVERHAHGVLTVSEHSRRDILASLNVSPDVVSVLPMPVHPQYAAPSFDRTRVERLGIRGPYILAVGTLEPRKNLRRLIKAFGQLTRGGHVAAHELVLAGPPGWDSTLAAFIDASGARDRIRVAGFVPLDHLPSLYHFASAVVYPSVYEGFGLPVLEAMCSSAVVLTSRCTSLPEVLGDGGMFFDPEDTTSIATAIGSALALSSCDADRYRRRCRSHAEMHLRQNGSAHLVPA